MHARRTIVYPLALILILTLIACQSLRVTTKPTGVHIAVFDDDGEVVAESDPDELGEPVEAGVDFDASRAYRVVVSPAGDLADIYRRTSVTLRKTGYGSLPGPEGDKELVIELQEKDYGYLDQYQLVVNPLTERLQAWRGRSRAFESLVEEGGEPPVRVVDLGPRLAIFGLDISPEDNYVVFGRAAEFRAPAASATGGTEADEGVDEVAIALASLAGHLNDLPACNLVGVKLDSGALQQITSGNHRDMFPAFAGQHLLFISDRRRRERSDILRISTTGRGGISNVHLDQSGLLAQHPSQADDGTIVFGLLDPRCEHPPYIWTVGGKNRFPTQITQGSQPRVSPDGGRIAFIGEDRNLWVIGIDGTERTQLTYDAEAIRDRYLEVLKAEERAAIAEAEKHGMRIVRPYAAPSWSPDGARIIFSSMEGSDNTGRPNHDIWIMKYDGSEKRQLTTNGSADHYPLMAPTGKFIYFVSNRGKRWGIYRIKK